MQASAEGVEYVPFACGRVRRKRSGGELGVDAVRCVYVVLKGGRQRGYEGSGAAGAHQWEGRLSGCSTQHRLEGAPVTLAAHAKLVAPARGGKGMEGRAAPAPSCSRCHSKRTVNTAEHAP